MATPNPTPNRRPRTRRPTPNPDTVRAVETALERLVNPPKLVAASNRTIDGVDYTVALYSDDSVRIARDSEPVATGRFVATVGPAEFPGARSIDARIVDVDPVAVPTDIVDALARDLTYFAFRAGRFSSGKGA